MTLLSIGCRKCHKVFRLKPAASCPLCGTADQWWGPVEMPEVQATRLAWQYGGTQRTYVPPSPPYGQLPWICRRRPHLRGIVIMLAVAGLLVPGLGAGAGIAGLIVASRGREQVRTHDALPDTLFTLAQVICGLAVAWNIAILAYLATAWN